VIYDSTGKVLVMQRQDDSSFWQSVTGSMEQGETTRDTAHREVLEETGIDIAGSGYTLCDHEYSTTYEIRPCWRHRYADDVSENREHLFSVEVAPNTIPVLTEHLAYQWLDKESALKRLWSDSNQYGVTHCVPSLTS
jgi:dATP pyrophosphohydrolase